MEAEVNAPAVHTLIATATKRHIGATDRRGEGSDRCQWRIWRPPFVTDQGTCMLLVSRQPNGSYVVTIGRQGMCADVYTEAKRMGVADLDVDAVVMEMCTARTMREANGGQ